MNPKFINSKVGWKFELEIIEFRVAKEILIIAQYKNDKLILEEGLLIILQHHYHCNLSDGIFKVCI